MNLTPYRWVCVAGLPDVVVGNVGDREVIEHPAESQLVAHTGAAQLVEGVAGALDVSVTGFRPG